jgi:hypothetical protein
MYIYIGITTNIKKGLLIKNLAGKLKQRLIRKVIISILLTKKTSIVPSFTIGRILFYFIFFMDS